MYGLRIRTIPLSIATYFDFFVPDKDMPDASNKRGYEVKRDVYTTNGGNTFVYDRSKTMKWDLSFSDCSGTTKVAFEQICHGWLKNRQIGVVMFGTSTNESDSWTTHTTNGQLWGTAFIEMNGVPQEVAYDLWNFDITITKYGTEQVF